MGVPVLSDLAIDTKFKKYVFGDFKISHLISVPEITTQATITQRYTGRPVQSEIAPYARARQSEADERTTKSFRAASIPQDTKLLVTTIFGTDLKRLVQSRVGLPMFARTVRRNRRRVATLASSRKINHCSERLS